MEKRPMKTMILAISALSALALSAGLASAQMQPIPNPPERPHYGSAGHGHHHHAPPPRHHHHHSHDHHKGH